MQKNMYKNKWALALATLVMLLSIGAALAAIGSDRKDKADNPENVDTVAEKNQAHSSSQDPKAFVPTEQVTADQAIAFPSDI